MDALSERQLEIVRATMALISDEGVNNFSIRKLARRVGVTEPAIYRHFENKDDLMMKLASYIVSNWHELIEEFPIMSLPVKEKVRVIFSEVVKYMMENRSFMKTLITADLFEPDSGMADILVKLRIEGLELFAGLLAMAQSDGELRKELPVESIARIFFGSVWWIVTDWLSSNSDSNLVEAWEKLWVSLSLLLEPGT